jgi:hypothetical protein
MKAVLEDAKLKQSFVNTRVLYHQFPLMNPHLSYDMVPRAGPFGEAGHIILIP